MTDELKQLHQLELSLAIEVMKICDKHNLKIVMLAGTLLGAIRHKGFIPWDDDMDFGMPREDFEKFKEVCQYELDTDKYFLQTDEVDKNYPFNFMKMRLNHTKVSEEFSAQADVHSGIYVDIFPINEIATNGLKRFIQLKGFWFFRNLLWIKCGYGEEEKKQEFSYKLAKVLSIPFSIHFLKRMKHKCIMLGRNSGSDWVVVSDGSYGLTKETFPSKWLAETASYTFDGVDLMSFKDYDAYLKHMYGDYMKLPPEDQRNHHKRLAIDFGPYKK